MLLIIILGGSRVFFKLTAERLRTPLLRGRKNLLIIGVGDSAELLVRELIKKPSLGYRPVGFLDNDPEKIGMRVHGVKVLGRISELSEVAKVKKFDEVVIALSEAQGSEIKEIIRHCRDS